MGFLVDRFGARRLLIVGLCLGGLGFVLIGVWASYTSLLLGAQACIALDAQLEVRRAARPLELVLLRACRPRLSRALREGLAPDLLVALEGDPLPLLFLIRARQRRLVLGVPALDQRFALGGEPRLLGGVALAPFGGKRLRARHPFGFTPRAVALLLVLRIAAARERRMLERTALRLREAIAFDAREHRELELPQPCLPLGLGAQTLDMGALEPPLRQRRELLVAAAQPALFDPALLGVDLDGKALRAARVLGRLLSRRELPELRFERLLLAQELHELGRRAQIRDRVGSAVDWLSGPRLATRHRPRDDPALSVLRTLVVEIFPGAVARHQAVVFFSIMSRMRVSRIAGGGTGTSLVRIRLEPSALY